MSGRLSIYLVADHTEWHGGVDAGDRYLNMYLDGPEWEALFFDVLRCPEPEPYVKGEDLRQYEHRFWLKFQQAIPAFPMLARLWDTYQDVGYSPEEVGRLREECREVAARTDNPRAAEGLGKLIRASEEALTARKGLFLVSD